MQKVQNNQQGRRSNKVLAERFLKLAQAGRSEREILQELDIPIGRAQLLHYKLLMEGTPEVERLSFIAERRLTVSGKGIFIPTGRLETLGLKGTFPAGACIRLSVREGSLVIDPDSESGRVQKNPAAVISLPPALLDNLSADEIAMGDSDESNA